MKSAETEVNVDAICRLVGEADCDAALLAEAFTHQTYAHWKRGARDNQRLEFLGDAVLGLLAADVLFHDDPAANEGWLTSRRSALVSGEALSRIAGRLGLVRYMRFAPGVRDATERTGRRTSAALVEALFGAFWLWGGIDAARRLFLRLFHDDLEELRHIPVQGDPRGRLQAISRERDGAEPVYSILSVEGNGHEFVYTAKACACGLEAVACGPGKRSAYVAAAESLLRMLGEKPGGKGSLKV